MNKTIVSAMLTLALSLGLAQFGWAHDCNCPCMPGGNADMGATPGSNPVGNPQMLQGQVGAQGMTQQTGIQQPTGYPQLQQQTYQPEPPLYIQLDKPEYGPNEQIHVRFKALPSFGGNAWIGMLDAGYPHGDAQENDRHDMTYQYLKNRLTGEMVFDAPKQAGNYDFRLNDGNREYYAVPFSVVEKSFVHAMPGVSITLDKSTYAPGETIKARFQAAPQLSGSAWIGLLDAKYAHGSSDENDRHDLAYHYLKNRMSGELTFQAPANPGSYDLRLNDAGREYFAVPFAVKRPVAAAKPKK